MEVVVPDAETLPLPVHPLHEYLLPDGPDMGEVTDAVMDFPASIQPLSGAGEP